MSYLLLMGARRRSRTLLRAPSAVAPATGVPTLTRGNGHGQTGVVGAPVATPLTVLLADGSGQPMIGQDVTWAISDGTITATVATSILGVSTVTPVLGTTAGSITVTATVVGVGSVGFTLTAIAGPAATIEISSGNDQQGDVSAPLDADFVGFVADQFGNPVEGEVADILVVTGGGSLSAASDTSDVNGLVNVRLTLGATPGGNAVSMTLNAVAGDPATTFSASGTSVGQVATQVVVISGQNQTGVVAGAAGAAMVIEIQDALGDPVEGFAVSTAVTGGGGQGAGTVASGVNGRISVAYITTGTLVGPNTMDVTCPGLTPETVTLTIATVAGPPAGLVFVQNPSPSGTTGQALAVQPILKVVDQYGNNAADTGNVVATVESGTLVVASGGTVALASNQAAYSALTLTPASGSGTLRFTRGSYFVISPTITLAPPVGTELRVVSHPAGAPLDSVFTYSFEITDANGVRITTDNSTVVTVALMPVTGAVLTGTSFTAAAGLVSCSSSVDLEGSYQIQVTAGSLTPATTNIFTINAADVGYTNQPGGYSHIMSLDGIPFDVELPVSPAALDPVYNMRIASGANNLDCLNPTSIGIVAGPKSPGSILRGRFPASMSGGSSPFGIGHSTTSADAMYSCMWIYVPEILTPNGNTGIKLFFFAQHSGGGGNHYVDFMSGNAGTGQAFRVNLQSGGGNRNIASSFFLSAANRNRWLKVEHLLIVNTGSTTNGIARAWVDGVQIINVSDVLFFTGTQTHKFTGPWFNPNYGGGSNRAGIRGTGASGSFAVNTTYMNTLLADSQIGTVYDFYSGFTNSVPGSLILSATITDNTPTSLIFSGNAAGATRAIPQGGLPFYLDHWFMSTL